MILQFSKMNSFPSLFLLWFILMQWAFPLFLTRIQDIKYFESSRFQKIKHPVVRKKIKGAVALKVVQVWMRQAVKPVVLRTPVCTLIPKPYLQICDFAGLRCISGIGLFQTPPSDGSNVNPGLRTSVLTDILEKGGTQKSLNIQCSLQCNYFTE